MTLAVQDPRSIEIKEWKPHKVQEALLTLPDEITEALYGGAAGGGKTDVLMMLPIVRGFYKHPRYKGIILRRTFPELESEVIQRSKLYYPSTGAVYNEQKKYWKWPWGAIQRFGHAENKKDIEKYDGDQYNYAAFDELTHFLEYQYTYLIGSRLRSADSNLPAIARSGSNPGREGHGWVRKRFVEPARSGYRILRDKKTGLFRIYIPARLTDNPHILENDPTYALRLQILSEAEKRAKLYGDWWTYEGQVFDFREERLPDEPENALHLCPYFKIPKWWPRFLSVDWGFSAKTAAHWASISPGGRAYIYRELIRSKTLISDWATELRNVSVYEDGTPEVIKEFHLDPSAFKNEGHPHTIAQQIEFYSGFRPIKAANDRVGGKLLLQDYLRWLPKPKSSRNNEIGIFSQETADRILRNFGPQRLKEYVEFFTEETSEGNLPKLQILEGSAPDLVDAIPQCTYDEDNKEDVKEFDGDDSYDNCRYLLQAIHRYAQRPQNIRENQEEVQIANAINTFQQTQDMTSFYRNMERIEAKQKASFGIRRRSAFRRN